MLDLLLQWYRRRFSDPQVIALLGILLAAFCILFFFNGLLAPLLVAVVVAYLLGMAYGTLGASGLFTYLGNQHHPDPVRRVAVAGGIGGGASRLAAGN